MRSFLRSETRISKAALAVPLDEIGLEYDSRPGHITSRPRLVVLCSTSYTDTLPEEASTPGKLSWPCVFSMLLSLSVVLARLGT